MIYLSFLDRITLWFLSQKIAGRETRQGTIANLEKGDDGGWDQCGGRAAGIKQLASGHILKTELRDLLITLTRTI